MPAAATCVCGKVYPMRQGGHLEQSPSGGEATRILARVRVPNHALLVTLHSATTPGGNSSQLRPTVAALLEVDVVCYHNDESCAYLVPHA